MSSSHLHVCFSLQLLSVEAADLKKNIPRLEREVKDATPDQRKLKSLQSSVDKLDKGKSKQTYNGHERQFEYISITSIPLKLHCLLHVTVCCKLQVQSATVTIEYGQCQQTATVCVFTHTMYGVIVFS